jgi:hypothetical protein
VGGQGGEAEGKGHISRQLERAGQYGSMPVTPSVGMSGYNTPIIRQPKVSLRMSRLCTSPVRASDFEASVTYGIGLDQKAEIRVITLGNPSRVVVDVLNQ